MFLGIGLRIGMLGSVFSPAHLFASNEEGAWYDPSDLSTLFQDSLGTTPVTTAGDPVGKMLDKSGRGNHATQATSAARPTYAAVPLGGRRNLLTFTEDFTNAAWLKGAVTVAGNTAVAPNGTSTADLIYPTTSGSYRSVRGLGGNAQAGVNTVSIWLKYAGLRYINSLSSTGSATTDFRIDLVDGVLTNVQGDVTASMVEDVNGWYKVTWTETDSARFYLYFTDSGGTSVTANGTDGAYFWGAQVEPTTTASNYQRVVTEFDVTEAGVQTLHYLAFDGVDDAMATGTITPGVDKAQVFAGLKKLSASVAMLMETNTTTSSGSNFLLSGSNYSASSRGDAGASSNQKADTASVSTIDTAVITATHDIAGDLTRIARNGVYATDATGNKGAGNFLAYPLYIGARAGTSLEFEGNMYGMVLRFGANLTDAQITDTEAYLATRTGVTL
jgi:hypothetical protein